MILDDLKDRFKSDAIATWERFQESPVYGQLRDRYENLTPAMQKLTLAGVGALGALLVFSIPYSYFSQSKTNVADYESQRMTIRELLKVSRESSEVPQIPQAPSTDSLRSMIEGQLQAAHLLPEQIKGTETADPNSKIIPRNLTEGLLKVSLAKLNIRQILDIGYQIQNLSPSIKLKDMVMTANREDGRYFDVVYKVVSLAVPAPPQISAEPSNTKSRSKSRGEE